MKTCHTNDVSYPNRTRRKTEGRGKADKTHRKSRQNQSIQRLGPLLHAIIRNAGGEQRIKEAAAVGAWPTIVGPEIASRTKALGIVRGCLYVAVESSTWAHHLSLLKSELISKFEAVDEFKAVSDIRFQVRSLDSEEGTLR